jgi:hypothetical protein
MDTGKEILAGSGSLPNKDGFVLDSVQVRV